MDWGLIPEAHRRRIAAILEPGEKPIATFEPDLDRQLCYASGLVALTDRRLLTLETPPANGVPHLRIESSWQGWPLDSEAELRSHERGGAGTLELTNAQGRLAYWR